MTEIESRILNVAAKGAIVGLAIGVVAALIWSARILVSRIKKRHVITPVDSNDKTLYEKAWNELESSKVDKGTWARAFSDAEGDEQKAKALYVKMRVRAMREATLPASKPDKVVPDPKGKAEETTHVVTMILAVTVFVLLMAYWILKNS